MKVIVTATNKGGEGKTTMSINMAEYLAIIRNKRVLIIDMDPQANLSSRYLELTYDHLQQGGKKPPVHPDYDPQQDLNWDGISSIADLFWGSENIITYPTDFKNIDIMPADTHKLQEIESATQLKVLEEIQHRMAEFLFSEQIAQEYDVVVIDTPPSRGPLTKAAIKAATHVIIPAQMEQFSVEGIYGMLQLWKQESYARPQDRPIELAGILPNQVRNVNLHKDFLAELKQQAGIREYIVPHSIKIRTKYSELLADGAAPKSVFELSSKEIARKDMEEACGYLADKVFK